MIFRTYLLIISAGFSYCFIVPKVITVNDVRSGLSKYPLINKYYNRHLIICRQETNGKNDDNSNKIGMEPNDMPSATTKFKQTRQARSFDFPPFTYADNLIDLPLEPEISLIVKSNRATRLVKERSYARIDAFEGENITSRPTLADLSPPTPKSPKSRSSKLWISAAYRLGVTVVAYFSFPPLTRMVERFVTMKPDLLNEVASTFAPGISILYGTFISLTLSILYNRIKNIQELVATESSLISFMTQNMLAIFRNDEERIVRGGQCIADQIRMLVKESRGRELMSVIYSDPYLRMLELVREKEEEIITQKGSNDLAASGGIIASMRDTIKDLMKLRSERLGLEALALPPTHYLILISLTFLIFLGFTISTIPTVASTGDPSNESSILFSLSLGVYILFFNFANDLNNPFEGVYQIRRSSAASHLLQTKWLIANHPGMRGKVDFEDITGDIRDIMEREDLIVWTPGLGAQTLTGDDMCTEERFEVD